MGAGRDHDEICIGHRCAHRRARGSLNVDKDERVVPRILERLAESADIGHRCQGDIAQRKADLLAVAIPARCRFLRVRVDDEDLVSGRSELPGEQDCGHRFSRPAFGGGDGDL